jgi:MscS family membrane protein
VEVENTGRRPFIRRNLNVTITYDTSPEKYARAVEILHKILAVPEATSAGTAEEATEPRKAHPNEAINQPDFPPRFILTISMKIR